MKIYVVLENNKPADCKNHSVDSSWDNPVFSTFEKASDYLANWLNFGPVMDKPGVIDWYGVPMEIREIDVELF